MPNKCLDILFYLFGGFKKVAVPSDFRLVVVWHSHGKLPLYSVFNFHGFLPFDDRS